jgi:hypothetical protein
MRKILLITFAVVFVIGGSITYVKAGLSNIKILENSILSCVNSDCQNCNSDCTERLKKKPTNSQSSNPSISPSKKPTIAPKVTPTSNGVNTCPRGKRIPCRGSGCGSYVDRDKDGDCDRVPN